MISWPNSKNQIGPNINWHFQKKRYSNEQERTFFFDKIKKKKKTELCKNFELYHDCFYKDECSFAHGVEELRQNCELPKYKAKIGNPSQRIQYAILALDVTTFIISKQKDFSYNNSKTQKEKFNEAMNIDINSIESIDDLKSMETQLESLLDKIRLKTGNKVKDPTMEKILEKYSVLLFDRIDKLSKNK